MSVIESLNYRTLFILVYPLDKIRIRPFFCKLSHDYRWIVNKNVDKF